MKRILCILLACCLLLPLLGCQKEEGGASFYYRRTVFQYGSDGEDGVIAPERRNITGHESDLNFLVSLYLAGPLNDELISPFPQGVRALSTELTRDGVNVELSDVGAAFTDAEYALACACLSMTLLELTDADEITVTSGQRSLTLAREDLTLSDTVTENDATLSTEPEVPQ